MNCRQLQDQAHLGRSAKGCQTPSLAFGNRCQFYVLVLMGLAILASTAGSSYAAQSGKANKSIVQSHGPSAGIRDPMNPEAYMRDLAARMDPTCDTNLLLNGTNASQTAPGSGSRPQARPVASGGSAPTRTNTLGTPSPAPVQKPIPAATPNPTVAPPSPPRGANQSPSGAVERQTTPPMPAFDTRSGPGTAAAQPAPPLQSIAPGSGTPTASLGVWQPTPMPAARPAPVGGGSLSGHAIQNSARNPMPRGPGSVQKALLTGTSGLSLWEEPKLVSEGMPGAAGGTYPPEPEVPWTLGGDLEKYRVHAVKEGSRNSVENLGKALERAGMALGGTANVFLLGYASDRAKPFRENDGKGLFQEPGKVPARAGATIGSLGYALYSIVDLATLNALPKPDAPAYKDNHPLVRPVLFTGRTIGGVWKTTEEIGNALTWGLFDNVTGTVGLVIEDIVELLKHAGQAVTNVVRAPFHLMAGKKGHEGVDKALDWVLLVPLELASNAVEMKGFANMDDYRTAFADKGVIGSMLEFGGSTYIVYRAVDKAVDKHKKNRSNRNQDQSQTPAEQPGTGTPPETPTPPVPEPPVVELPPTSGDIWIIGTSDGWFVYND